MWGSGRWGLVVLLASLAFGVASASGATLSSLQTGTATSTANGTTTVTISAIDTTTSFLIFETRSNSNVPPGTYLRGRIASSTTLEFARVTSETATINIRWYVASFSAGVRVQRGEVDLSAATVNVTITAVAALAQAFVTVSKTAVAGNSLMNNDDEIVAELTSTTNVQIRADTSSTGHTISWQVIEFTRAADINVQKGTSAAMSGTTASITATLSPAVDVDRTFVLVGYRSGAGSAWIGDRMLRAVLTNSTTVTIDRAITGSGDVTRANAWTTGLTHTAAAGSNRLLLFAVAYEHTSDTGVSTVTYGTQTLTKIVGKVTGAAAFDRVELWYLLDSGIAAASNSTFVVTWGAGAPTNPMYAAVTYTGVDQSSPVANSNSFGVDAATPNPVTAAVTSYARAMAVGAVISGNDGTYTWNNGWTEGTDQANATTTNLSTADHLASADGTDTASATHSNPNRQAIVAAVLNPITEDISEVFWQAVELKDGSTVQGGSTAFSAGTAQQVVSLTRSVNINRSVAFAASQPNGGQNGGRSAYDGDDLQGVGAFTFGLSATQLTIDRNNTADAADVGWFVVQFRARKVLVCERWPNRRVCRG